MRKLITVLSLTVMIFASVCVAYGDVLYAEIPDNGFPIPMLNGAPIAYENVLLPEEGWEVTTYVYSFSGSSFMESYKEQLREAGFVDLGNVQSIESLWRYDRSGDGATLMVEMGHNQEEERFSISMYVNYLNIQNSENVSFVNCNFD